MTASLDHATSAYPPIPALLARAEVQERPWPILQVGTGGVPTVEFYISGVGYQPFKIIIPTEQVRGVVFARLMEQVRDGFGRTLNRLPAVFGVTRQTLYNWLSGETPKASHQGKVRQLAAAAQVFCELGFKPTPVSLDRPLVNGKSILEMLSAGANGKEVALKLVRLERHGADNKERLSRLLAKKPAREDSTPFSARWVGEGDHQA